MLWVLLVFGIIFTILVEIFTIVLMLTGLSHTKSRFQIISVLTGTGYTTSESELIMMDPRRRKYTRFLIVFGYCANVTIVSVFVGSLTQSYKWYEYVGAISICAVLLLILKNKPLRKWLDPKIYRIGSRFVNGKDENYLVVLETINDQIIGKVKLRILPDNLKDKTVQQLNINNQHGISILAIERGNSTISNVSKNDYLLQNDLVIVYGNKQKIESVLQTFQTLAK